MAAIVSRLQWVKTWDGGNLTDFLNSHYFPSFLELSKHLLPIEYHVHIWQVLLSLAAETPAKYECDS